MHFEKLAVTEKQVEYWNLPTREPKRATAADRRWPYDFACELDAIPPDRLRSLVWGQLEQYLPEDQMSVLRIAEESERRLLRGLAGMAA